MKKNQGPYGMNFICRDSPYGVHFICRDCPYGVYFNSNKTLVKSVQLGKIFDPELSFVCPPPQGIGLSVIGGRLE